MWQASAQTVIQCGGLEVVIAVPISAQPVCRIYLITPKAAHNLCWLPNTLISGPREAIYLGCTLPHQQNAALTYGRQNFVVCAEVNIFAFPASSFVSFYEAADVVCQRVLRYPAKLSLGLAG